MSEQNDKRDRESPEEESAGPVGGERLAQARRELQIPALEIAKELHLDEYKVRALECNDFDVIGAPVFAKGHLRKFAQLVKVDEADIMADYYQLTRSAGGPPALAPRRKPRREISPGPWIAGIVVVLAVAAVYWWFVVRAVTEAPAESQVRPMIGEIVPLPEEELPAQPEQTVAENTSNLITPEPVAVTQPAQVIESIVEPASSSDMSLSITYSGDCWTEITDAMGRRMFFGLGKVGRTVNLSGEAPFNVLFGDASNVSLVVDGAAFDIPAADRRGRTARLTITGS